jgi:hypothetical protein
MSSVNGGTARSANDVFVWGIQAEVGGFPTSYIPTAAASANRVLETTSLPAVTAVASTGSVALTFIPEYTGSPGLADALVTGGSAGRYLYLSNNNFIGWDGTNNPTLLAGWVLNTPKRGASSWTGSTYTLFNVTDSTTTVGTFDGTMETSAINLGEAGFGLVGVGGVIKQVCIDPSPLRCR